MYDYSRRHTLHHSNSLFPQTLKEFTKVNKISYLGNFLSRDQKAVVVIGSRDCTCYGRLVTRALVAFLVKRNITIVSGLARGLDTCAHQTALDLGGRTLGFLGYGLGLLQANSSGRFGAVMSGKILGSGRGAVFSPFSPDTPPSRDTFIYRNNVMAAFGRAVVVVEAGEHSGTFHTVNAALDYGVPVVAVPGSVFSSKSVGTHKLINEGAALLQNFSDLLEYV
jgi:DNA processing protein